MLDVTDAEQQPCAEAPVRDLPPREATRDPLPERFARWFEGRGWRPHAHQLEMLRVAAAGDSALLIAPTGGGKTLAGFLPSLADLDQQGSGRPLHTLYISPLKALTADIGRNLAKPIAEMALPVRCEIRTGDTPQNRRARQRASPPDILLTTPESLALLIADPKAPEMFERLACVVVDELHALAPAKRGQLLALGLARLTRFAPGARLVGLSATVKEPHALLDYRSLRERRARLVIGAPGPEPDVTILLPTDRLPWAGHYATYAVPALYETIRRAGTTLVFVNTRAQAEIIFQALWRINDEHLPIALHHGSLAVEQRRKVEAAMAQGGLKAVVCTSSLDLGIDWGDVDLVVQIGAPKGVSRILQRIGRANHRLDQPSRALLVPGNRFEVLECMAALDAIRAGTLDGEAPHPGGLDVLAQHLVGVACCGPFDADEVYAETRRARPYRDLSRRDFDDVLEFVATGGYALGAYERFRRLKRGADGLWRLADRRLPRRYRMNVGTIVEAPMVRVRLRPGRRVLGEMEEAFVSWLTPGDVFQFAGRGLRFERLRDGFADVSLAPPETEPNVPSYMGTRMAFTTHLADRVRGYLADPGRWRALPGEVKDWLDMQQARSILPEPDQLLIETFPRRGREFLVVYAFAGWNAHQTLGMLLTRRMERHGLRPLGFNASDYMLAIWSLKPAPEPAALFDVDILGEELEDWMADSSLLKRTFRNVAVVAGLIERRHPGHEKSARQLTVNSDLIYDVLRKHEPQHVLLRATRAEAAVGLMDVRRLADLLVGVEGRIVHRRLERVSPLAVPVLMAIGQESVAGAADDSLLEELAAELIAEAMGRPPTRASAPSGGSPQRSEIRASPECRDH
jgi:ATP-dependent helicase Lhr and Lhr-like helicase